MRLVRDESELAGAIARARSEAKSSFGDDSLYVEKFVEEPRHIEIQILADKFGNAVHLFERECSIQRRHQKVIEESPSPFVSPALRERMGTLAVGLVKRVGYVNAGTLEFLVDEEGNPFFLEMNTRLQVEHPVTEMVTGLDLVRLQIEVAQGRPLPIAQDEVAGRGHALECRIYAEDPERDDLPSPGKILHLSAPHGPGIRFDEGVATGSEVTVHYDPLLAKLITWGRDRRESTERMAAALREAAVLGVVTNVARLQAIVDHPAFRAGALHTGFLDEHLRGGARAACPPAEAVAAALAALAASPAAMAAAGAAAPDAWSALGARRLP
jgi:3-methylcrotonyl-CoA carboxylase alpha subunit